MLSSLFSWTCMPNLVTVNAMLFTVLTGFCALLGIIPTLPEALCSVSFVPEGMRLTAVVTSVHLAGAPIQTDTSSCAFFGLNLTLCETFQNFRSIKSRFFYSTVNSTLFFFFFAVLTAL